MASFVSFPHFYENISHTESHGVLLAWRLKISWNLEMTELHLRCIYLTIMLE